MRPNGRTALQETGHGVPSLPPWLLEPEVSKGASGFADWPAILDEDGGPFLCSERDMV